MPPRTFLAQERPNWPEPVPEHLSDIADSQVNNLERIVSGTAKQMQLVMAEVQGGNPALHGDDLDAVRAPVRLGIDRDEKRLPGTLLTGCMWHIPEVPKGLNPWG